MKDCITFYLNREKKVLKDFDPNLTVLDYLRSVEGLTGTKEGCAEGDCGACTVVVCDLHEGQLRYRPVNSCILFLASLNGRQLITIEGLSGPSGELHPVQKIMIEKHGSQCGFCTPGMIMSLFGLYKNVKTPDKEQVLQALAGNLCRCTGYRPIIEVAMQMGMELETDYFMQYEQEMLKNLREVAVTESLALTKDQKCFFAPCAIAELAELKKEYPQSFLLAGGTDLGLLVNKVHRCLPVVISLLEVPELRILEKTATEVIIGSAVSYEEALPLLREEFPSFADLLVRVGSRQIRNRGTIAGNLANASPIGDSAPALLALGASLELYSAHGKREVPLSEFFRAYRQTALGATEFISSIRIPRLKAEEIFRNYKISKRFDQDISTVNAAFCLKLNNGKVEKLTCGFGGMAAVPLAFSKSCASLLGHPWTEENIQAAATALSQEFSPMTDFRASADYRRIVLGNLLRKFFYESVGADQEWMEVFSHE